MSMSRHITTDNLEGFCLKDGFGWAVDEVPPPPSDTERAQAMAGHVDVEIEDIKRRAGLLSEGREIADVVYEMEDHLDKLKGLHPSDEVVLTVAELQRGMARLKRMLRV